MFVCLLLSFDSDSKGGLNGWSGGGGLSSIIGGGGGGGNKHALIDELTYDTKFNKHDLAKLYSHFQKVSSGGRLNRKQFEHGLKTIGQTDKVMIDQLFTAFDHDKDGSIDFREFACGLSVMHTGSMEERLEMAFKAYDLDGNGVIDHNELFSILKASFKTKGFDQPDEMIKSLVAECFAKADLNKDGGLDLEEFKSAVLQHQIVVQSFWKSSL